MTSCFPEADSWNVSIYPLHASLPNATCIWHLVSSVNIWDEHCHLGRLNHHASSSPCGTERKSFFNYCHYFWPQPLYRSYTQTSEILLWGHVTFSVQLISEEENKEWGSKMRSMQKNTQDKYWGQKLWLEFWYHMLDEWADWHVIILILITTPVIVCFTKCLVNHTQMKRKSCYYVWFLDS